MIYAIFLVLFITIVVSSIMTLISLEKIEKRMENIEDNLSIVKVINYDIIKDVNSLNNNMQIQQLDDFKSWLDGREMTITGIGDIQTFKLSKFNYGVDLKRMTLNIYKKHETYKQMNLNKQLFIEFNESAVIHLPYWKIDALSNTLMINIDVLYKKYKEIKKQ